MSSDSFVNESVHACAEMLITLGFSVVPPSEAPLRRSLCEGLRGVYSVGGHIGGLFLVLFASLLGVVLPFLTKYVKCLASNPYAFAVGKTAATGVLLSVSTIHLINEGIEALEEPCIPRWLTLYGAYAFLFALIAVLLMQALDLELATIAEGWLRKKKEKERNARDVAIVDLPDDSDGSPNRNQPPFISGLGRGESARVADDFSDEVPVNLSSAQTVKSPLSPNYPRKEAREEAATDSEAPGHNHSHNHIQDHGDLTAESHGHQHAIVLPPKELGTVRHVIAAVSMEFGVALHSIFVGVAVGLTTDQELKPLLIALFFHQSFEGMAMGSRIVDASFDGGLEIALALIFVLSAPAGMAVAIGAVSVSRDAMSGGTFVAVMGILDAFCGGILLYLAFTLLLIDFPEDLKQHCPRGDPRARRKKVGLFTALWFGMLLMAAVGNWL